jgi:photosystem II stability/assembly factor-like uncharacterized protein
MRPATSTIHVSLAAFVAASALVFAAPSWTAQTSGVGVRLRGMSVVNERVAWASGANGTILVTTDGGQAWTKRTVPGGEALDFRDVDAVSDRVAYALSIGSGETSRIYKTEDAGATWRLQFTNRDPKGFLDAMAFWDAKRGVAFGDSIDGALFILTTTDGGGSWNRIDPKALPAAVPEEGAYAASGTNVAMFGTRHVWIGTSRSRVLRSSNAGRTWDVATAPVATGASAGIFSIAFRDERHGIVVGGDYRKEAEAGDNAAITSDGGRTWTALKGLSGFRSAVQYVPGTKVPSLVAVGPAGTDYSADDGKTWQLVEGPGFDTLGFARSSSVAWAAGAGGRIGRLEWR